jgi:DNA repair exonuclease SbcCD ATPase subunit
LAPGTVAVIAEIDEDWVSPLNTRMEAIGGSVAREWRSDFAEAELEKESAARKAEFAQLRAEFAQARADAKAKLQTRINEVKAKLDQLSGLARAKLQELDKDTNAKVEAINEQIAKANANTKARIKERLAQLRADHDRRAAKLKEAGALVKEALAA